MVRGRPSPQIHSSGSSDRHARSTHYLKNQALVPASNGHIDNCVKQMVSAVMTPRLWCDIHTDNQRVAIVYTK